MKIINKKIISSILLFICLFLSSLSITKAYTLSYDHSGYYYLKTDNTGAEPYPGTIKRFSINHRAGFCIEWGVEPGEEGYTQEKWENTLIKDKDLQRKVSLIAYYGYDYEDDTLDIDHATLEYRVATQVLIWETLGAKTETKITIFSDRDRKKEKDISKEKNEILQLVSEHDKVPSFSGTSTTLKLNEQHIFTDENNIIKKFDVVSNEGATAKVVGNTLVVTPNIISDNITITLTRKDYYESEFAIYHDDTSQDVIVAGEGYPVSFSLNIKSVGPKVKIEKVDSETMQNKAQGEATLEGAVYGIYTLSDDLVTKLTTDALGYATSSNLNLGSYYIKEISASRGYLLDNTKYNFELTDENDKVVQVKENVIKGTVKFIKVLTNGKTGFQTPEAGIEFGIYNKNNTLIGTYTTDKEGKFEVTLPYGKYILKQITTTDGYEKLEDYEFEIKEPGEATKVFADGIITSKLKVLKVDATNNKVIPLAHVKFKIYDIKNKKYIEQVINYPVPKTINVFETNEEGIMITPEPLEAGEYYLEEVDAPINGYLWNKEKIKFTIDKNSNFIDSKEYGKIIEIKFANTPVKGKIELIKIGKFLDFQDLQVVERQNKLANVKFGLYARENIYDGLGQLIYKKNKLIGEYTTNEEGYLEINNLYLGKYYLKELATVDNYILNKTKYNVDLEYINQYTPVVTHKITLENYAKTGILKFLKIDEETKFPLTNVAIEIYQDDDTLVFLGVTNEEGIIEQNLPIGKYYLIEKETLDGYVKITDKQYFEIQKDKEVINITLENRLAKGIVKFLKIDSITHLPMPGVLMGIYQEDGTLVYEGETNEKGFIELELPLGKYYLKELKTLDKYVLNEDKLLFEIKEDGEVIELTMENKIAEGRLEFLKIDAITKMPLGNVLIAIYDSNEILVFEGRTKEDGTINLTLPIGNYYLIEIEALPGYILDDQVIEFTITDNDEVVECTMENNPMLEVEVPDTYADDVLKYGFIPSTIALAITAKYIEEKKKKTD